MNLNNRKTMDPSVSSDTEETLNVYHYTYNGPQPYNYEPVMRPREQGETRGRVNGQRRERAVVSGQSVESRAGVLVRDRC